jgi:ATP-binding cassette subfamily C protein CydD
MCKITPSSLLTNLANLGKISAMNLDRRLLKQIRWAKGPLALTVLAGFLGGLAIILQASQLSQIINAVFLRHQSLSAVMPWMWGLLAVVAARGGFTYLAESAANAAALRIKERLREDLTRKILSLGPAYTQGERSGEVINTVTQGIEALDAYFSQYLPQLALAGLLPIAFLLWVFPNDPLSGVVLLLTGPLIPFFMSMIGSVSKRLTERQWGILGRMSAYFLDTLQGLATLKALGRSRAQAERIGEVSEQYRETTMSVLRVTFLSALVLELLSTIGTAIIAVEIGLRLLYGRIAFEQAFFVLLLAPDFYLPLRNLGLRFHASMSGVSAAKRIFEVLERPLPASSERPLSTQAEQPLTTESEEPPRSSAVISLKEPFVLTFEKVCFTYPGRQQAALEEVCLEIGSGQTTALVGASGAGKSTLAGLVLGFIHADSGKIRVNGTPIEMLAVDAWREQIAWVPQQPYLFHGTIAENLRLARPQATLAELRQAAEQAHLLEFIDRQPLGMDTPVGEGGAQLSGGQGQRLALARAFLRDAPFLILDEPTAHLDVAQERLLQETSRKLAAGRTVLVIAHRLSTVAQADQIIVMNDGRVFEKGRPADLLGQNGLYAQMMRTYQGENE